MEDLSVPLVKYSPTVRIGNWFEEYCLEEDEIQNFLAKRRTGSLLTQKTRRMFSNLLREIELAKASPFVKFGDVVQFVASDLKISKDFEDIKPVLSLVVTEKRILQSQQINEESEPSIAPCMKPCVRNTFIIKSPDAVRRDGEVLKFGQEFLIESTQGGCPKFILFSSPKCQNLSTAFEPTNMASTGGEIVLPVGVCPKISPENFPNIPTGHARWKCQHLIPSMRFQSEGEPVPSNTRLLITHVATNQNLAAENVEFQTFFGNECLVSVHNYLDKLKRVQWQNVWSIHLGNENDDGK